MELFTHDLVNYLDLHSDQEGDLLKHIERETHLKVPLPRMLSGHYQGRVLSMIAKMIKPNRILEIGTFTGYATLCLAEGLGDEGSIHTIEINAELEDRLDEWFSKSEFAGRIHKHFGNAADIIPHLKDDFDLVFIDADKKNNALYYDLLIDRLKTGAVIIVDNVLWNGKVLNKIKDTQTTMIEEFNRKITADNRVEKLILPVRDGLFIIRKK